MSWHLWTHGMPCPGGPAGLVSYGRRLGRPFGVSAAGTGWKGKTTENVKMCGKLLV